jgi:exo-1,4-beta-D-glucosaminidase
MTFFVRLDLRDARGRAVSDNFYWLSAKADTLDWAKKQDTVYTPQAEFADLTGLAALPMVRLETGAVVEQPADAREGKAHIRVKNPSNSVAFQIRLRLAGKKDGLDVVPVFWDDNYFSLLPGEERLVSVRYDSAQLHGAHPVIQVGGFNITPGEIATGPAH